MSTRRAKLKNSKIKKKKITNITTKSKYINDSDDDYNEDNNSVDNNNNVDININIDIDIDISPNNTNNINDNNNIEMKDLSSSSPSPSVSPNHHNNNNNNKIPKSTRKSRSKSRSKSKPKLKLKKPHTKPPSPPSSDNENDNSNSLDNNDESATITYLPCRETEQNQIYTYILKGLQTTGSYSSLYIPGMPGTGKTASVLRVLQKLKHESQQKQIPPFTSLYINGMEYTNPNNVFKTIYTHIFEDRKTSMVKKVIHSLDTFFSNRDTYTSKPMLVNPTNPHLLLILDEVDCLINQKQNLLYNIFNWTTYSKSKLIVISISNTIDLPNRLIGKVKSRMGTNRITFQPYKKDELHRIISVKIDDVHLFSEDALRFSSVKVAAVNGDLRRILLICKRAKEIFALERKKDKTLKQIKQTHIIKACNELFDSKLIKVIKSLKVSEKIILATILYKMKDNSDNRIKVSEVYDKKDIFINKYNEDITNNDVNDNDNDDIDIDTTQYDDKVNMTWEEFQMIMYNLVNLKIISFNETFNENFIDNTVTIRFYTDEFMNAVVNCGKKFKRVSDLLQTLLN